MSFIRVTDDIIAELQQQDQVIVEFFAPWCGYCRRLYPIIRQVAMKYDIWSVNVDELGSFSDAYGIRTIPALLVLKKGKSGKPLVNPMTKKIILDWLKEELDV